MQDVNQCELNSPEVIFNLSKQNPGKSVDKLVMETEGELSIFFHEYNFSYEKRLRSSEVSYRKWANDSIEISGNLYKKSEISYNVDLPLF